MLYSSIGLRDFDATQENPRLSNFVLYLVLNGQKEFIQFPLS
jgi:hypothetical protein